MLNSMATNFSEKNLAKLRMWHARPVQIDKDFIQFFSPRFYRLLCPLTPGTKSTKTVSLMHNILQANKQIEGWSEQKRDKINPP